MFPCRPPLIKSKHWIHESVVDFEITKYEVEDKNCFPFGIITLI